jgi:hypothetical protein
MQYYFSSSNPKASLDDLIQSSTTNTVPTIGSWMSGSSIGLIYSSDDPQNPRNRINEDITIMGTAERLFDLEITPNGRDLASKQKIPSTGYFMTRDNYHIFKVAQPYPYLVATSPADTDIMKSVNSLSFGSQKCYYSSTGQSFLDETTTLNGAFYHPYNSASFLYFYDGFILFSYGATSGSQVLTFDDELNPISDPTNITTDGVIELPSNVVYFQMKNFPLCRVQKDGTFVPQFSLIKDVPTVSWSNNFVTLSFPNGPQGTYPPGPYFSSSGILATNQSLFSNSDSLPYVANSLGMISSPIYNADPLLLIYPKFTRIVQITSNHVFGTNLVLLPKNIGTPFYTTGKDVLAWDENGKSFPTSKMLLDDNEIYTAKIGNNLIVNMPNGHYGTFSVKDYVATMTVTPTRLPLQKPSPSKDGVKLFLVIFLAIFIGVVIWIMLRVLKSSQSLFFDSRDYHEWTREFQL